MRYPHRLAVGTSGTLRRRPIQPPAHRAQTAGYTAAILWDLHDAHVDNHDQNPSETGWPKASRSQWAVLMGYDPAPSDPNRNQPASILELWDGVKTMYPLLANRLSAIYDENEIPGILCVELLDFGETCWRRSCAAAPSTSTGTFTTVAA